MLLLVVLLEAKSPIGHPAQGLCSPSLRMGVWPDHARCGLLDFRLSGGNAPCVLPIVAGTNARAGIDLHALNAARFAKNKNVSQFETFF